MQKSARTWPMIFTGIALVIAVVTYLIFAGTRNAATEQVVAPPAPFGSNNYNIMKTDTFVALVSKAYGNLAEYNTADGILEINMKNANELTKDFFNGNDALLPFKLGDHGFEFHYNPEDRSLKALFKIDQQNGVHVPNDVLIKLMDKTTTTQHVDNK